MVRDAYSGLKFLVIDDNERWRRFMRCLFQEVGMVIECSNGTQACDCFENAQPDWVLMDVFFQNGDGFAIAEQLKLKFPSVKLVFISQHQDDEYFVRASELGAGFILKDEVDFLHRIISSGVFEKFSSQELSEVINQRFSKTAPPMLKAVA